MQIKKSSKNKKIIAFTTAILLLVVGGGVYYLYSQNDRSTSTTRPMNDVDYGGPTEEEVLTGDNSKQEEPTEPDSYNTPPATSADLQATIVSATQANAGEPLMIRVLVTGAKEGSCDVTLTKDGEAAITKSFPIIFEATSSRCNEAMIAAGDFPSEGKWKLSLIIKANSVQSSAVEREVTIKK